MSNNDNFDNKDNKRSKRTKKVDGDSGHKKPWDGQDHILGLSVSVMVKDGTEKQMPFYEYLKRWLVAILAYDARPESEAKLQTVRKVTGVTPDCMDFSRVPRIHTVRARNLVFILSPLSPLYAVWPVRPATTTTVLHRYASWWRSGAHRGNMIFEGMAVSGVSNACFDSKR
jgi:hypothetical protein